MGTFREKQLGDISLLQAGMIKDIGMYLWSSYREYVGTSTITDIDFALIFFQTIERRL
jgi:hypothetical protein